MVLGALKCVSGLVIWAELGQISLEAMAWIRALKYCFKILKSELGCSLLPLIHKDSFVSLWDN